MLSRTADNLYWLSRYVERADSLARILDVTKRLSVLPETYGGNSNQWASAIATAGCSLAFAQRHGEADEQNVIEFLVFARENSSSIRNCLERARTNARAVRTALTAEMWDTINGAWQDFEALCREREVRTVEIAELLSVAKAASIGFDGSSFRTMLRSDGYAFSRLGVYIERADNTARILDVKYHLLLPSNASVGGSLDYFQWASILRSVSALTAYRWVYRESVKPWLVADLLVLSEKMPRSLASCYQYINRHLDDLALLYGRQGPSQRRARAMLNRLTNTSMDEIFQSGLHEMVSELIVENNRLGNDVTEQYLI